MNQEGIPVAQKSIWGIIGDVFFSPISAFEAFKLKPTWVVPLILTVVLAALAGSLTYQQDAAAQYEMLSQSTSLPPAALEQMRADAQDPSPVGSIVGAAIAVPLITLVAALFAWFMGSFVFGQKAKYSHVWAVGLLAGLISLVGNLLRAGMVSMKDSIYVSFGPAALMSGSDFTSILYSLLFFTDIFAIWSLIVAGFGYASIFGLSQGKGMTISVILHVIAVAILVGLQQIGFAFAGVETSFF